MEENFDPIGHLATVPFCSMTRLPSRCTEYMELFIFGDMTYYIDGLHVTTFPPDPSVGIFSAKHEVDAENVFLVIYVGNDELLSPLTDLGVWHFCSAKEKDLCERYLGHKE